MTTLRDLFNSGSYTDADAIAAINGDADHGSTAQHDYYTDSDVDTHLTGGTGIDYSSGTISRALTISSSAPNGAAGSNGDV